MRPVARDLADQLVVDVVAPAESGTEKQSKRGVCTSLIPTTIVSLGCYTHELSTGTNFKGFSRDQKGAKIEFNLPPRLYRVSFNLKELRETLAFPWFVEIPNLRRISVHAESVQSQETKLLNTTNARWIGCRQAEKTQKPTPRGDCAPKKWYWADSGLLIPADSERYLS